MNISEKVLEKIKNEKIEPKPKWKFLLKNSFLNTSLILFILIGGISFSVILYILFDRDWYFLSRGNFGFLNELLFALPYFWILFLLLFLVVGYYNFYHTKTGYKYRGYLVVIAGLLGSLFLGILLFSFGIGHIFNKMLVNNLPEFDYRGKYMSHVWSRPNEGMLAGKIILVKGNKIIILESLKKERWEVDCRQARLAPHVLLEPEFMIRAVGEKKGEFIFTAKEVRPYKGRCPFNNCPIDLPSKYLK